ncbi:MAG: hypothetical protein EBR02_08185 [Alphaproteobacteria bacterium]|nr:hypothetical protein [Alphaproteobacteria bacterium]
MPAKAGIHALLAINKDVDPGLRRDDGYMCAQKAKNSPKNWQNFAEFGLFSCEFRRNLGDFGGVFCRFVIARPKAVAIQSWIASPATSAGSQ